MDSFAKDSERGRKPMFKCAYCGKEYSTVSERTKCEIACEQKAKAEANKKAAEEKERIKKEKITYVNSLWNKASDAFELAKKTEDELHKNYPDAVVTVPKCLLSKCDSSNTFNVTINGNEINDENVTSEIKKLFTDCRANNFVPYSWLDKIMLL